MKSRKLWVECIILMSFLAAASEYSVAQNRAVITPSGNTSVSASFKTVRASATIHTVKVERTANGLFPLGLLSDAQEMTLVQGLEIFMNGQPLFVPRSVFADLLNPRDIVLNSEGSKFALTINGGDGANSYFVQVRFDTSRVNSRMLYSSLMPRKAMEETYYRRQVLRDE